MIDLSALHAEVELMFGSALQSLPLLERGVTIAGDRLQHFGPIGEEKSVPNIKENDAMLCHDSILPKASVEWTPLTRLMLLRGGAVTAGEKNCNIQWKFLLSAAHGFFSHNVFDGWLRGYRKGCALAARSIERPLGGAG